MIQYTCPKCGTVGAHSKNLDPPKCHRCQYEVIMLPSRNGRIIKDQGPVAGSVPTLD